MFSCGTLVHHIICYVFLCCVFVSVVVAEMLVCYPGL